MDTGNKTRLRHTKLVLFIALAAVALVVQVVLAVRQSKEHHVEVSAAAMRQLVAKEIPATATDRQVFQFLKSRGFQYAEYEKAEWKAEAWGPFSVAWPQATTRIDGVKWNTSGSEYATGYLKVEFCFDVQGRLLGSTVSGKASER